MNSYSINILDLNGIDVHDYYYPNWVGCGGFIFRYKPPNQNFFLFSLPSCYLEDMFSILIYLGINNKSEILNKYIDGGGMIIDDEMLNNPWSIKDKGDLIDNLKLITNDKIIQWSNSTSNDKYISDTDEKKLFLEMVRNLVLFLLDSQEHEVELIYI